MNEQDKYLSVRALTKYIKRKFDADPYLRNVYVKGEISNFKHHTSGHLYFTLKDEKSQIPVMMNRYDARHLQFRPEDGMSVFIVGDVSVYEAHGKYQLYVKTMQPDGVGELYLAFEQLKKKLAAEGLFNEQWKQSLPLYPNKIGIITASTGAVIKDIHSTIKRRYPLVKMTLFPVAVQGEHAVPSIVDAIERANIHASDIDVLIVGRGGGSIEDLWAFNDEAVARAIFSSKIPIISAVGHETDTTIADFVADLRAPTPTAAAEIAVPSQVELLDKTQRMQRTIQQMYQFKINEAKKRLIAYQKSYPLQYPERLYRPFIERLADLEHRFERSMKQLTTNKNTEIDYLNRRLQQQSPLQAIKMQQKELNALQNRLYYSSRQQYKHFEQRFAATLRILSSLNPLHVMERGFAIVYHDDEIQKSVERIKTGNSITIQLQDGTVDATVQSIKKENP
ncbi:MAG TPA: exodeoxyribonuclease VII large subunit [Sporosarcina sp.]|nr:exodeoxyribonuclease VII large subunit [Sporosarcina sp.]